MANSAACNRLSVQLATPHSKQENCLKAAGRTKKLSAKERDGLLVILKTRFQENVNRHKGIAWAKVQAKLEAIPEKLWSLHEMESTGGEPDVIGHDKESGEYIFFDCAADSPQGRKSICYDREGFTFSPVRFG